MAHARIIAHETFGAAAEYRFDVLSTRFGGFEFFVLRDGEVIRQHDDLVLAVAGLHAVPGIGDAVERAVSAIIL